MGVPLPLSMAPLGAPGCAVHASAELIVGPVFAVFHYNFVEKGTS